MHFTFGDVSDANHDNLTDKSIDGDDAQAGFFAISLEVDPFTEVQPPVTEQGFPPPRTRKAHGRWVSFPHKFRTKRVS